MDNQSQQPINYGLRFLVASILSVPTLCTLSLLYLAPTFRELYEDMLRGKPLSFLSGVVVDYYPMLSLMPLGVFAVSCFVLFSSKRIQFPYYFSGCAFVVCTLLSSLTVVALYSPILQIFRAF